KNSLIFERKSRHESRKSIAVVLHIYYVELVPQVKKHLQNIPYKFDLLVSTMSETQKIECETLFQDTHNLGRVDVRVVPNIGRDVAPLLITFKDAWSEYEYICHIHTKRSPHTPWGDMWRAFIYEKLLGDPQIIRETLEYLERDEECALLFPENFPAIKGHMHNKKNTPEIKRLLERVNYTKEKSYRGYDFAAGTMQWFKTKHFRELVALEFEHKEFKNSNSDLDGTLAHALERFFSIYAQKSGHRVLSYYSESRNRYLLSDSKYYS
ncbi:MAG: rhamnan synthesis F family protein, partial [Campylobacterota bacterium]|nr:rhamnan synthesis F family protein [Campylobacterota bacterium]